MRACLFVYILESVRDCDWYSCVLLVCARTCVLVQLHYWGMSGESEKEGRERGKRKRDRQRNLSKRLK